MQSVNTYISKKYIVSGNKVESYDYSVPIKCDFKRDFKVIKGTKKEEGKREDNLSRARANLKRTIWANMTPHTKFLTLTCADICLDKKVFMRRFQTFLQQMSRHGYKLRYVYVLERQLERGKKEGNEGTIHAHLVVFNDEKIPLDILNSCWHYGDTDIHVLNQLRKNGEKVRDIGCYVSKYITKEANQEWGSRCYNCSKGLCRAVEIPVKIMGNDEIGTIYDDNIDLNLLAKNVESLMTVTYKDSFMCIYNIADTPIYQIIDYQQGYLKAS